MYVLLLFLVYTLCMCVCERACVLYIVQRVPEEGVGVNLELL